MKTTRVWVRWALTAALMLGAGATKALCVLCVCNVTTSTMAFGNYNPLAFGNTDTTASISVGCGGVASLLLPFKIDISTGGSGSFANRRMNNGANLLYYNIYTDSSYTTVWGDGTASTLSVWGGFVLDIAGLAPAQVFWAYGRIPGRQITAIPAVYTDSINVTLTYY